MLDARSDGAGGGAAAGGGWGNANPYDDGPSDSGYGGDFGGGSSAGGGLSSGDRGGRRSDAPSSDLDDEIPF